MGDKQRMEGEVDAQLLEVGERLSKFPSSKDALCKLLKQASTLLGVMSQSIDVSLLSAMEPVKKALGKANLLKHKDKDVRLLVAACVSEVMRIVAPDAPYDDEILKDVFEVIVASFRGLNEKSSPHFERRVSILEVVANFRLCVVMLDIECHDLIQEMFHIFLTTVSEEPKFVMAHMKTIMCTALEESEEIPDQLLQLLLGNLLKGTKVVSKSGNTLARAVVQQCAEQLVPYAEAFLTSVMSGGKSSKRWRESCHDLIFEIYTCAPSLLVPLISKLTDELLTNELDVRLKVVKLLGRMFASQQGVSDSFEPLFTEFMKRITDKAIEVRLAMVECTKQCLLANPSGARARDFLTALSDRLQDVEDGVRLQVVLAICDFAESNPELTLVDELKRVADRMRDRKETVRRETVRRLTDLYRSFCSMKVEGVPVNEESFYWIPSKLIRCCFDKDSKEFRSQGMELVFSDELFPTGFPVQERVKCWIAFFSAFDSNDVKALQRVLQQKKRLHSEMQNFLLRHKDEENQEDETNLQAFCKSTASFFADPANAEVHLQKLLQLKDSKLRKDLATLLDSSISLNQSMSIRTGLLNRLGEKHPQYEFLKVLTVKCSYCLFGKEHMRSVLSEMKELQGLEDENKLKASMRLLVVFANHFPTLLDGAEEDVMALLKEEKEFLKEGAVEVLAKIGGSMRGRFTEETNSSDLLEKLCIDGNRKQAKYAVQALAAMSHDSGSKIFSVLYRKLLDLLESGVNLPTVLQSLGCIAQHATSVFEKHEEDLVNFLVRDLFTQDDLEPSTDGEEQSAGAITKSKIYGLKTLVKSFLPNKDSQQVQRLKGLFGILMKFLELGEIRDEVKSSDVNKAYLRLIAAKGVLRLVRRYEAQISAQLFQATVLCAKDPFLFVKRQFVGKVQKLLKERHLPHKYACALALSVGGPDDEFWAEAKKQLYDFIDLSRRQVQLRDSFGSGTLDTSLFPEYVLFFLVHVLAHQAEFPKMSAGGPSLEDLEPFFRQLYVFLWALLKRDKECIPEEKIREGEPDKLLLVCGVFTAMKDAEDIVDASKTENTYILSDIGIRIAKKLVSVESLSPSDIPAIPLPKPIYRSSNSADQLEGSHLPSFLMDDETLSSIVPSGMDMDVGVQKRKADHHENGFLETKEKSDKVLDTESSGRVEEPVQKRNKITHIAGNDDKLTKKDSTMTELSEEEEKVVQKRKSMADLSATEEKQPVQKRHKVSALSKINGQQESTQSAKLLGAVERPATLGQKKSRKEKAAKLKPEEKPKKLAMEAHSPVRITEQQLGLVDEHETLSSAIHEYRKRKRIGEADAEQVKLRTQKVVCHELEVASPIAVDRHEAKIAVSETVASDCVEVTASDPMSSHDTEVPAPDAVPSLVKEAEIPDGEGGSASRRMRISIKKPKPLLRPSDSSFREGDSGMRILIKKPKPPLKPADSSFREGDSGIGNKSLDKKLLDGVHKDATDDTEALDEETKSWKKRPRKPPAKLLVSNFEELKSKNSKREQAVGEELVHKRICVWWPLDKRFYPGTVSAYNADKRLHDVDYDDGDKETLNLKKERWKLIENEDLDVSMPQSSSKHGLKEKERALQTMKNSKEKSTKSLSRMEAKTELISKPEKAEGSDSLDGNEETELLDGGCATDDYRKTSSPVLKSQSKTGKHVGKKASSFPKAQSSKSTLESDLKMLKERSSPTVSEHSEDSDDVPLNTWALLKKKVH